MRTGYDGAQDYDFLLRTLDQDPVIHHIPRVSYHWRMARGSTARASSTKAHAGEAGCRALREFVGRNGISAGVEKAADGSTSYRLRYEVAEQPRVHLLDASRSRPDIEAFDPLPPSDMVLLVEVEGLADDHPWLDELVAVAAQPGIGLVAPAFRTPQGLSAGAGYTVEGGRLIPLLAGEPLDRWTESGWPAWPRNVVAVGGCALLRVGLARNLLANGARPSIVSLSLGAHRRGLRNVHWPFAGLVTSSRLPPVTLEEPVEDPYRNPNSVRR
jgi:hypothetical protein